MAKFKDIGFIKGLQDGNGLDRGATYIVMKVYDLSDKDRKKLNKWITKGMVKLVIKD